MDDEVTITISKGDKTWSDTYTLDTLHRFSPYRLKDYFEIPSERYTEDELNVFYSIKREDIRLDPEYGKPFTLSDRVRVTDPCYDMDVWCAGTLTGVHPGTYIPLMRRVVDGGGWGTRVARLEAWLEGVNPTYDQLTHENIDVGVDGGQAGIFDEPYYAQHYQDITSSSEMSTYGHREAPMTGDKLRRETLYQTMKELIEDKPEGLEKDMAYRNLYNYKEQYFEPYDYPDKGTFSEHYHKLGTCEYGVISSSGLGDGSYDCYTHREDGKIVGIILDFWDDFKEDEED